MVHTMKHLLPVFFLLCLSFSGLVALPEPVSAQLRAGAAKIDMTPDVKAMHVPLGGYAARRAAPATGVHDPVFARALVLADGTTKVGIVSLDLCFLPDNLKAEVVRRVQDAGVTGLDSAHLLIAATHTHSAPDPLAMHNGNTFALKGWTPFDAKLLDFTAGKIAEAVVQADRHQVPAQAGCSVRDTVDLNRNRRGETTVDPALTVLKVTDMNGHPLAAVVDFASHPTLYDDTMMAVSADWPGVMTAETEQAMGSGAVCLFLNGAEGDASPKNAEGKTADERVADYGHKVGRVALELLSTMKVRPDASLAAWTQTVVLPPRKANALFLAAAAALGATLPQARQFVTGLMPERSRLGFVRIADLLLMGFPCEPTSTLGLTAKAAARRAGFVRPAVVALANDWLAYALTPEQYREGKYEAMMSFYGDQLGPTLLDALETGLKGRASAQPTR